MKLVFITTLNLNEEPYTTSKVIAEHGGQEHRAVRQLIETYQDELNEFGRVTFEMVPFETKGGLQNSKVYYLNEQQVTFLITLMRNTRQVVKFKKELVKQFYEMRLELQQRKLQREMEIINRKELTQNIKRYLGDNPSKFISITQLIYRTLFGTDAKGLRNIYGVVDKKISPKDFMSKEEVQAIYDAEYKVLTMLELGLDYQEIKKQLNELYNYKRVG